MRRIKFKEFNICRLVYILTIIPAFTFSNLASAQEMNEATLNKFKATFLVSFLNYIESNKPKNSICVLGDDRLLAEVNNKIGSKNIAAKSFTSVTPEIKSCGVIYIGARKRNESPQLINLLDGEPVITVSSVADFIDDGGIIEMYEADGKLKFAINLKKANSLGFKVGSKLIELADKTI